MHIENPFKSQWEFCSKERITFKTATLSILMSCNFQSRKINIDEIISNGCIRIDWLTKTKFLWFAERIKKQINNSNNKKKHKFIFSFFVYSFSSINCLVWACSSYRVDFICILNLHTPNAFVLAWIQNRVAHVNWVCIRSRCNRLWEWSAFEAFAWCEHWKPRSQSAFNIKTKLGIKKFNKNVYTDANHLIRWSCINCVPVKHESRYKGNYVFKYREWYEKNYFYMPYVKRLPFDSAKRWFSIESRASVNGVAFWTFKSMRSAAFVHVLPLCVICKSFFTRFDKKIDGQNKKIHPIHIVVMSLFYVNRQHTKVNWDFVCGANNLKNSIQRM